MTEDALLRQAQRGDAEAFAALVEQSSGGLYRFEWAGVLVAAAAALAPFAVAWAAPVAWASFQARLAQGIAGLVQRLPGILNQAPASLAAGGAAAGTAVGYAWYVLPFILWAAVGLAVSYATIGYATGYTVGDESGRVT